MATESISPISGEEIDQKVDGLTVPKAFRRTVEARGDAAAIRWKDGDAWGEWSWNDYADKACRIAAGLRELGVQKGGTVALMMRNIAEFHPTDVGALLCGATPFSIYNSSSPEQVQYLVDHSEASVAIVENLDFLERFLKVRDEMDNLEHLVVLDDPDGNAPDDVITWDSLLDHDPVDLAEASEIAEPDDLVTLIYTSGTTGPPKAVMLTHRNVVWTAEGFRYLVEDDLAGKRIVSYLPMAHIAERMVSHYNGGFYGTEVTCCPETGEIGQYLAEVKPNVFFAVPRVWEKLHAGVLAAVSGDPERKAQLDQAIDIGKKYHDARLSGQDVPDDLQAAYEQAQEGHALVKSLIGLDQCEVAFSGAAPIPHEVLWFFIALGLSMSEIYGLSETCGPLTWDPYAVRVGTVGRPWPGTEVRLDTDGEVLGRGGNIFQGYYKEPEKTAEALDDQGWLHTGDIGEIDDDGYLAIVDRKKELIITAGGKNISPANVEKLLKTIDPIGQTAVIGDQRPYLVALLVLDPDTAPGWAKQELGIEGSIAELAEDEKVIEAIQREVDEVNQHFNRQEQIKKFKLLGEEWQPDSAVLTPTMKLKRRGVNELYGDLIEELYGS